MANDDAFLRFARYKYDAFDNGNIFLFAVTTDGNFRAVRNFFLVIQQYLFTYDFRYKKAFITVCQILFAEIRWRFRQMFNESSDERVDIKFFKRRNRKDHCRRKQLLPS